MGRRPGDITIAPTETHPAVNGLLLKAVVLPPDSEVVAPFALNGGQLGTCALVVPSRELTEEFGVVVGHTLVDASTSSANVLMINPNAEEVVLPCRTCIGKLVPISAVSVARSELQLPADGVVLLPEYLEDIVKGYVNWGPDRTQRQPMGFPSGASHEERRFDTLLCRLSTVKFVNHEGRVPPS